MDNKLKFDNGNNSDILAFLNAYNIWKDKFANTNYRNFAHERKNIRKITIEERDFCNNNFIDMNVLREVKRLVADLKIKLIKLNLYQKEAGI